MTATATVLKHITRGFADNPVIKTAETNIYIDVTYKFRNGGLANSFRAAIFKTNCSTDTCVLFFPMSLILTNGNTVRICFYKVYVYCN